MAQQQKRHQQLNNALELPKKEQDARIKQPIQAVDVIYINSLTINFIKMNTNFLFAVDINSEEVLVSESPKGSNKVIFIERIGRNSNEMLYNAVITLTSITKSPSFDTAIFKAMDKVCQMIYAKHKGSL
jgi:hypothetical protein